MNQYPVMLRAERARQRRRLYKKGALLLLLVATSVLIPLVHTAATVVFLASFGAAVCMGVVLLVSVFIYWRERSSYRELLEHAQALQERALKDPEQRRQLDEQMREELAHASSMELAKRSAWLKKRDQIFKTLALLAIGGLLTVGTWKAAWLIAMEGSEGLSILALLACMSLGLLVMAGTGGIWKKLIAARQERSHHKRAQSERELMVTASRELGHSYLGGALSIAIDAQDEQLKGALSQGVEQGALTQAPKK